MSPIDVPPIQPTSQTAAEPDPLDLFQDSVLEQRKEFLATDGWIGISEEASLKPVQDFAARSLEILEKERSAKENHTIEEIRLTLDEITELKVKAAGLSNQAGDLHRKKLDLEYGQQPLMAELHVIGGELLQYRARVGRRNLDMSAVDEILQELDTERTRNLKIAFEAEKERFAIAREIHETNAAEASRRAAELTAEKQRIEERIHQVESMLVKLREIGITRTTAGMLTWAGYLIMAGAAYSAAQVLPRHGTGGLLYKLLDSTAKAAEGEFWTTLLSFCGGIMATLFMVALFAWVIERLLRRSKARFQRSPKRGSGWFKPFARLFRGAPLLGGRDNHKNDDQQQFSFLPPRQLIAALPFLVLTGVLLVLCAKLGLRDALDQFPGSYIGWAIVLGVAAIAVLYANFVLGPRLQKALQENSYLEIPKLVRREAFFLIGLLTAAIATSAVSSILHSYGVIRWEADYAGWALFTLFLCLASLPFACGLAQKGLFKDYDQLEIRRDFWDTRITNLLKAPMMLKVAGGEEAEAEEDDTIFMTRQKVLQLRALDAIQRAYQPDFADPRDFEDFGRNLKKFFDPGFDLPKLRPALEIADRPESILAVVPVPDPILQRWGALYVRRAEHQAQLNKLLDELMDVKLQLDSKERRMAELENRRRDLSVDLLNLQLDFAKRDHRLRLKLDHILSECLQAYRMGKAARGGDDPPPPPPRAVGQPNGKGGSHNGSEF